MEKKELKNGLDEESVFALLELSPLNRTFDLIKPWAEEEE